MQRSTGRLPAAFPLGLILFVAACAATSEQGSTSAGNGVVEGTVASIDTKPWAYDGHAVVEVDVAGQGRVAVQLPARWNLCKAQPVDVEALQVGMRVQAVGEAEDSGRITVCAAPEHRLAPL